jgi:hypothetical protein
MRLTNLDIKDFREQRFFPCEHNCQQKKRKFQFQKQKKRRKNKPVEYGGIVVHLMLGNGSSFVSFAFSSCKDKAVEYQNNKNEYNLRNKKQPKVSQALADGI